MHKVYFVTHTYTYINLLGKVEGSEYRIYRVHTKIQTIVPLHFISIFWMMFSAHGLVNGHHSCSRKDPAAKLGVSVLR